MATNTPPGHARRGFLSFSIGTVEVVLHPARGFGRGRHADTFRVVSWAGIAFMAKGRLR